MLTDDQIRERRGRITSSIAAAALGIDQYMTPIDAWLAVKGELPRYDTKATQRGHRLEQLCLDSVAEDLGLQMRAPPEFRARGDWSGDSADALYMRDGVPVAVGEAKSASLGAAAGYGDEDTDEVPQKVLVQCHWHLIHWPEVDVCWSPVLVGGYKFEFRRYKVMRDAELEGLISEELQKWHRDYVVSDRMPPAQSGDDETMRRIWPHHTHDKWAEPTPEIQALAERKIYLSNQIKILKSDEDEVKNLIRQSLGDSEGVRAQWGTIYNRQAKGRKSTDWQSVAYHAMAGWDQKQIDDVVAHYTKERQGPRVLRVYYNKAE